jgi:predicted ATPase
MGIEARWRVLKQEKLLELRVAMRLNRLWQCQARYAKARELLAEVYNWFTEGFDTGALRQARRCSQSCPDRAECRLLPRNT